MRALLSIVFLSLQFLVAVFAQDSAVGHKSFLYKQVAQQSSSSCAPRCVEVTAHVGNVLGMSDAVRASLGAKQLKEDERVSFLAIPRKVDLTGQTEAELESEFDAHVRTHIASLARSISTWMKKYGVGTGHADIVQLVNHRGTLKRLVVNVLVFDHGGYFASNASIFRNNPNEDPGVLYVKLVEPGGAVHPDFAPADPDAGRLMVDRLTGESLSQRAPLRIVSDSAQLSYFWIKRYGPRHADEAIECFMRQDATKCATSSQAQQFTVQALLAQYDMPFAIVDIQRAPEFKRIATTEGVQHIVDMKNLKTKLKRYADFCPVGQLVREVSYDATQRTAVDRYLVYPNGKFHRINRYFKERSFSILSSEVVPFASTVRIPVPRDNTLAYEQPFTYSGGPQDIAPVPVVFTEEYIPLGGGCPTDVCLNIDGLQSTVPSGFSTYFVPALGSSVCGCPQGATPISGTGIPSDPYVCPAAVDLCTNIPGMQILDSDIPGGLVRDYTNLTCNCFGNGVMYPPTISGATVSCAPPPAPSPDVCANIAGWQGTVPPPLVASGPNCVCPNGLEPEFSFYGMQCPASPPVDVCANLAGQQASVPAGLKQAGANCICENDALPDSNGVCPVATDVCQNLPGNQTSVPAGLISSGIQQCVCANGATPIDSGAGYDCPLVVTDFCPNIDGVQIAIPTGMSVVAGTCLCDNGLTPSSAGICPLRPPDQCLNIPGNQLTVPAGLTRGVDGNCGCGAGETLEQNPSNGVHRCVTDQCSNIDGMQADVPAGLTASGGRCYCPGNILANSDGTCPVDVCPNIAGFQSAVPVGYIVDVGSNCVSWAATNATNVNANCPSLGINTGAALTDAWVGQFGAGTHTCTFTATNSCAPQATATTTLVVDRPPTDMCSNIPGAQINCPSGLVCNSPSYPGECRCSNGDQPQSNLTCPISTTVPLDVCINIPGDQTEVPVDHDRIGNDCICRTPSIIAAFSPPTVLAGETSTLSWTHSNARNVSFACDPSIGLVGSQTLGGSRSISIAAPGSYSCVITASNTCSGTQSTNVTLTVTTQPDICSNLPGIQTFVPNPLEQVGTECLCPAQSGVRPTPENLGNGVYRCDYGPIGDICPNLDGQQSSIPVGFITNGAGDCVCANGVASADGLGGWVCDLCTNISGIQTSVPPLMTRVGTTCNCTVGAIVGDGSTASCECPCEVPATAPAGSTVSRNASGQCVMTRTESCPVTRPLNGPIRFTSVLSTGTCQFGGETQTDNCRAASCPEGTVRNAATGLCDEIAAIVPPAFFGPVCGSPGGEGVYCTELLYDQNQTTGTIRVEIGYGVNGANAQYVVGAPNRSCLFTLRYSLLTNSSNSFWGPPYTATASDCEDLVPFLELRWERRLPGWFG
jgi:hypothetical protein